MTKKLSESSAYCCLCGGDYGVHGHSPFPLASYGRACDDCNYRHVIPARMRGPTRTVTHQVKPRLFIWHLGDRVAKEKQLYLGNQKPTEQVPTSVYRYHLEEALDVDFMLEPTPVQSLTIDDNLTATVVIPADWDRDISLQPVSWVRGGDAQRLEFEDVRL